MEQSARHINRKDRIGQPITSPKLAAAISSFYRKYDEANRLNTGAFQLEFARTQELLKRFLPEPPATLLDVGGGPGAYSCWLAQLGYEVHLIDPVPSHIEQAKSASQVQPDHPIASFTVGDARQLEFGDAMADAVLLLGPLYHLLERAERIVALREAYRTLKNGGLLFVAAISRFACALDGVFSGWLNDPIFADIVRRDLQDGRHRNPTDKIMYFTDSYFHRVEELEEEIDEAGFVHQHTLAIEGPFGWLQNFDEWWKDSARRERLLEICRAIESEPSLIGASAHILVVARKDS